MSFFFFKSELVFSFHTLCNNPAMECKLTFMVFLINNSLCVLNHTDKAEQYKQNMITKSFSSNVQTSFVGNI